MTTTSAPAPSGPTDQAEGMLRSVGGHWGWVLAFGILTVVVGVALLAVPGKTLITIAIFFAAYLFVSGIFMLVRSFTHDGGSGGQRVLSAIVGVLAIGVGLMLLRAPFQALEVMIFTLGFWWVFSGIMDVVRGFQLPSGRGWAIFMGFITLIAGLIILAYPIQSADVLALIAGIMLIILGVFAVVASFQVRNLARKAA
ncbi:MAG TPA: DUF308 domain-containing protein [Candidatus Limnocylindrales bacterium]|jgi:uncharacterized membrane protein HdeD (DUF308 family)